MKMLRKLLYLIIIVVFSYIVISSIGEHILMNREISNFKKSCEFNEEMSTEKKRFYSVSRETYEPSFTYANDIVTPGAPLDILVKLPSSVEFPVAHEVLSFTVGGHAALVCEEYEDENVSIREGQLIETAYNSDGNTCFVEDNYYWEDRRNFTTSYIVLRVKLTEAEKRLVMKQAVSYIGDKYNLFFLFNTKKTHYCSDLMTKAFKAAGINLNYDGFATTIYDLIASSHTEIVMYKNYDQVTGISHYYGVNL